MILYGVQFKNISTYEIKDCFSCVECGQTTHHLHIYQRVAHIYHIPFFPLGRICELQCAHCKAVTEHKAIFSKDLEQTKNAQELSNELKALKKTPRTPWTCYIGLAIVLAIGSIWGGYSYHNSLLVQEYLNQPKASKMLIVKLPGKEFSQYPYTFAYIDSIEEEKMMVYFGRISSTHQSNSSKDAKLALEEFKKGDYHRFEDPILVASDWLNDVQLMEIINK